MNALDQSISDHLHTSKEGYHNVLPWFRELKIKGLNPLVITMDGEISVIRAIREVWPQTKIQRCLYHIQREGLRWLRSFPKTQAGRELRAILSTLASIKSFKDRDVFLELFHSWINAHYTFIKSLPNTTIQFKDLKKTVTLIKNALPDMFHYLENVNIPSTTNALEGFYSRLKSDYQRHRGLSSKNRMNYLNWYCYLKNNAFSTIF
jgi:transposase-like protein